MGKRFEDKYREAVETTLVHAWRLNQIIGGSDPYPLCTRCGAITMGHECKCERAAGGTR